MNTTKAQRDSAMQWAARFGHTETGRAAKVLAERVEELEAALQLIANLNDGLGLQHAKAIAKIALGTNRQ